MLAQVNPFIGTENLGNTYPGAARPFGMVQFSPDTGHNTGYAWDDSVVRGFSLAHLSGVGCGIAGYLPVLPVLGSPVDTGVTDYADYAMAFSHNTADDTTRENASPGYFQVKLTSRGGPEKGAVVNAELSATERTAVQRYTFPSSTRSTVMVNAGQTLTGDVPASVQFVDDHTIRTAIRISGFCQSTQPFTVFTETSFDRPFASHGTWTGGAVANGSDTAAEATRTGAWATFDTTDDRTVEAVTSMSYVDADGAHANLTAETAGFDRARTDAEKAWVQRLSQVRIPAGAASSRELYSSLYRSFLSPNIGNDVDGSYRGWDGAIHRGSAGDRPYYQNFSLWDTYRTQQQLLAMLAPKESADMAVSLIRMGEQGGWLPRWAYGLVETNIMTGDPVTPFLVSAWHQGLLTRAEADRAYALLLENADGTPPADLPLKANGRAGNPVYVADGFAPYAPAESGFPGDYDLQHGASATLEYALADATLATMARDLGHDADAERLAARGQNYRAIWDAAAGTFRPRDRSGAFVGDAEASQAPGFHEGTASQYRWLVQQDVPGLMRLLSKDAADPRPAVESRLDEFFAYDKLKADPVTTVNTDWVTSTANEGGYGRSTYNPNNEPDLHAPYMYLWTGRPDKTVDVVRAAMGLFTDSPRGVTGNDDMGTMSAWYVLSAMGVYPIIPGSDVWGLTTPAYDRIEVRRGDETAAGLTITADGVSDQARYTTGVTAGGHAVDTGYLSGADLKDAGTLDFAVATKPGSWATGKDAAPGAINPETAVPSRVTGSLADSVLTVAPGASARTSLELLVQSEGDFSGRVEVVSATPGLTVDVGDGAVRASGARTPVAVSKPVGVSASNVVDSDGSVVLRVVADGGASRDFTLTIVSRSPWLQAAYSATGIGTPGQPDASFDEGGAYYLREALEKGGFTPSSTHALGDTGLVFTMPAYGPGAKDNIPMNGQTIAVPASIGSTSRIALVGSATNASPSATGTATLTFADPSGATRTTTAPVRLTDWCKGSPDGDNSSLIQMGQRVEGDDRVGNVGCGLFATAPIATGVAAGSRLVSITLPTDTRMHLFAIAAEPSASGVTLAADPASAKPGDTVTLTATVSGVQRDGVVVLTDAAAAGTDAGAGADAGTGELGRARVVDGVAAFPLTPTAGTHSYRAAFVPADPALQTAATSDATEVVVTDPSGPKPATVNLDFSAAQVVEGGSVELSIRVDPVAEGTVFVSDGIVERSARLRVAAVAAADGVPLVNGAATVTITPTGVGVHTYSVRFVPADAAAPSSSASASITVLPRDATGPGDPSAPGAGSGAGSGTGSDSASASGGALASTGDDPSGLVIAATLLVLAGLALLVLRRRREV
nr:GH92 family glycosyl hydrolase [Schumannella luteola]